MYQDAYCCQKHYLPNRSTGGTVTTILPFINPSVTDEGGEIALPVLWLAWNRKSIKEDFIPVFYD